SASSECQSTCEVRAVSRTPRTGMLYRIDKLQELITAWQREFLRTHRHPLKSLGRVAVDNPCLFCHLEYMLQSRDLLLYRIGHATLRNARAHSLQSVLVTH